MAVACGQKDTDRRYANVNRQEVAMNSKLVGARPSVCRDICAEAHLLSQDLGTQ